MARWARRPPSPQRVKLVLVVIAICAAIFAGETIWGWPEALTPNKAVKLH